MTTRQQQAKRYFKYTISTLTFIIKVTFCYTLVTTTCRDIRTSALLTKLVPPV